MASLRETCINWFNHTARSDWRDWSIRVAETELASLLNDPDIEDDDRIPASTTAAQLYETMSDIIAEYDLRNVGDRIRSARITAGMTQAQVAEKIGSTQSMIGQYERGEVDMSLSRLITIMQAVGVGPEILADL